MCSSSHSSQYCSIAEKFSDSQTGPQPMEPSPRLAMTTPGLLLTFLKRAAPAAIGPDPPTMALFG